MRYRKLSTTGDYVFGQGKNEFYVNVPDAVAQAVKTRLLLLTGEWFLDKTEGTPYSSEVLGTGTQTLYNLAIRNRILDTQGVTGISSYSSNINPATRELDISATISTVYGQTPVQVYL